MYYYKFTKDGEVTLLTYDQKPVQVEGMVELTKEEYDAMLAELLANISEPEEPLDPTYEELAEAYTILTGGDANE